MFFLVIHHNTGRCLESAMLHRRLCLFCVFLVFGVADLIFRGSIPSSISRLLRVFRCDFITGVSTQAPVIQRLNQREAVHSTIQHSCANGEASSAAA